MAISDATHQATRPSRQPLLSASPCAERLSSGRHYTTSEYCRRRRECKCSTLGRAAMSDCSFVRTFKTSFLHKSCPGRKTQKSVPYHSRRQQTFRTRIKIGWTDHICPWLRVQLPVSNFQTLLVPLPMLGQRTLKHTSHPSHQTRAASHGWLDGCLPRKAIMARRQCLISASFSLKTRSSSPVAKFNGSK